MTTVLVVFEFFPRPHHQQAARGRRDVRSARVCHGTEEEKSHSFIHPSTGPFQC